jgi:uncharacterized membrane protein
MDRRISTFALALGLCLFMVALMLGFFYAWICSTMWGLDLADPRIAISAMQAMNSSVRNFAFGPVFFGTPFVLLFTAFLGWQFGYKQSAGVVGLAGLVCLFGYLVLTATINVPMNEALGATNVPSEIESANALWRDYSERWQFWNSVRFGFTALAFGLLTASAVLVWPKER